jgi:hypothetical protein
MYGNTLSVHSLMRDILPRLLVVAWPSIEPEVAVSTYTVTYTRSSENTQYKAPIEQPTVRGPREPAFQSDGENFFRRCCPAAHGGTPCRPEPHLTPTEPLLTTSHISPVTLADSPLLLVPPAPVALFGAAPERSENQLLFREKALLTWTSSAIFEAAISNEALTSSFLSGGDTTTLPFSSSDYQQTVIGLSAVD